MAIVKPTPAEQRVVLLNSKIKTPRERYTIRCIKEEYGPSKSSGNPMYTLTWEVVCAWVNEKQSETFVNPADGTNVNIAGVECRLHYVTIGNKEDKEKTLAAVNRLYDMADLLGFADKLPPKEEGIDPNNPPRHIFEKLVVDAILDAEEYVQRKDPTPAQRAKKEMGDPILLDGKEMKGYSAPNVVSIIRRSDLDVSARPF